MKMLVAIRVNPIKTPVKTPFTVKKSIDSATDEYAI